MTHTLGTSCHTRLADGRSLHWMVGGDGPTTVVFESGMGVSRSVWGLVAPRVAEATRAIVYDRAGTGRSDRDPAGRSLTRLVDDLEALLADAAPGPVILVGHSWGGPIVRSVAARLGPQRVHGVVVVDQVDEHCEHYFDPSAARRFAMTGMTPALARVGLYRLMGSRPGRVLPADVYADHRREDFSVAAAKTMNAEMATFVDDLATLRESPPDMRGIPLTVISGTRSTRLDRTVRASITAAHRMTVEGTPGSRLVEATGSAHLVIYDEPGVIVDETLRPIAHAGGGGGI